MNNTNHITQKESRTIQAAFLLISLPIIYNTGLILADIVFNSSISDYTTFNDVAKCIISLMAPFAYYLLSLAASNRAIRNILRITAAAVLLKNLIWLNHVSNESTLLSQLLQSTSYIINILVICYLWGAIRRNYILDKKEIRRINIYVIGTFVILPILLDSTALFCNQSREIFCVIQAVVNITEIALLYMVITPKIFCANSTDIQPKEQYRFWNKYHLWWFIGVVSLVIISLLIETLFL